MKQTKNNHSTRCTCPDYLLWTDTDDLLCDNCGSKYYSSRVIEEACAIIRSVRNYADYRRLEAFLKKYDTPESEQDND